MQFDKRNFSGQAPPLFAQGSKTLTVIIARRTRSAVAIPPSVKMIASHVVPASSKPHVPL
jgi:hypothetical protein